MSNSTGMTAASAADRSTPDSDARVPVPTRQQVASNTLTDMDRTRSRRHLPGIFWRWAFLMILFIYIFAMAMTLFEIDAFQTLVAQTTGSSTELGARAGNSRQREILPAVRSVKPASVLGGDAKIDQAKAALYERVAANLDPLEVATDLLTDIGVQVTLTVRNDETFKRAQLDAFRELANRIDLTVTDLRKRVPELRACDNPGTAQCERLQRLRRNLAQLDVDTASLAALLPATTERGANGNARNGEQTADDRGRELTAADLEKAKQLVEQIVQQAKQVQQELPTGTDAVAMDNEAAISLLVQGLGARLAALQDLSRGTAFEVVEDSFELADVDASPSPNGPSPVGQSPGPRERLNPITTNLRSGSVSPQVEDLRRLLQAYSRANAAGFEVEQFADDSQRRRTMDAPLVAALSDFQRAAGIDVDGRVGPNTRAALNQVVDECDGRPQACFP
ncbi:MAG: peptidoglycan-binding protein, partial [Planctomycetes bacterium]|nr:peptidoglycan-binding protein [Planctomycetota bacterium]